MDQLKLNFKEQVDFDKHHAANPHIYEAFKKKTFEVIEAGHQHFSADMIYQQLRWLSATSEKNSQWKLNNIYRSYYARLFAKDYPQYKDFFRFRESKANEILNKAA